MQVEVDRARSCSEVDFNTTTNIHECFVDPTSGAINVCLLLIPVICSCKTVGSWPPRCSQPSCLMLWQFFLSATSSFNLNAESSQLNARIPGDGRTGDIQWRPPPSGAPPADCHRCALICHRRGICTRPPPSGHRQLIVTGAPLYVTAGDLHAPTALRGTAS